MAWCEGQYRCENYLAARMKTSLLHKLSLARCSNVARYLVRNIHHRWTDRTEPDVARDDLEWQL